MKPKLTIAQQKALKTFSDHWAAYPLRAGSSADFTIATVLAHYRLIECAKFGASDAPETLWRRTTAGRAVFS